MARLYSPEETHLSNGIPVIFQHFDAPVAATYWWVNTGSADENGPEAGFAHFLEHMLFKDAAAKETGKASTGKMARAIESLGGDINAYTSFDQTVYHVTCAAHHWERVVDAFGAMAKPQRFLKDDFVREREVILEELRKNEDSPGRQLFQSLFSQTFKKHPYGRPVIGYAKVLKAANVGALEAFYRRQYVPGRMGLVMVGPLDDSRKKQILKLLEKHYGSKVLKKSSTPLKNKPRPVEVPLAKSDLPTVEVKSFDVKTPTLSVSFRVPSLMDDDTTPLDLLSSILGMGELSRLYQRLFYQTSLVNEVSGGLYVPKDPGMMYFQAEVSELAKIVPAYEEIFKELRRIRDEGPTDEELARVIVNAESERLYATQSADGTASRVGFLKFTMGDLEYDRKYLDELRSIDAARVREVAAKYLDPRRMSLVILVPKENKDYDAKPIAEIARSILASPVLAAEEARAVSKKKKTKGMPTQTQRMPAAEVIRLPSGMKVALLNRPNSHVFSVHASVLGGLRLESPKESGISHLMSMTWTKGTNAGKNARDIAAIVEGSAAGLDGFSGRNSVGMQLTGLARDWDRLSDLLSETLTEPSFPEEEVTHSRRVTEDSIRSIEDHSSQLCSKLFLETLFERHPYGRMTLGTLESIANLNSEQMKSYHRTWVRPDRLTVSISGPVARKAIDSWLKKLEDRMMSVTRSGSAQPMSPSIEEEAALKAPRWIEKSLGREQVHVLVGGLGIRIQENERFALRLLQTILGGQSGRLFIELREKKSLAYTVAPVSFEGLERGYVGTYIASAPPKRQEAIQGIQTVLEQLSIKGPTDAEMKRAKEFYLGQRAMGMQSDSSLAAHYGLEHLYDIPLMSETDVIHSIEAVTADDVRRVCRKYLVEPHMVTSSV